MDTRIKNDLTRIQKQNDRITNSFRYTMGTPMVTPTYEQDIHIRLQKWSGNTRENGMEINNYLRGLGQVRTYGGNSPHDFSHHKYSLKPSKTSHMGVVETRLVKPAWETRDTITPFQGIVYDGRPPILLDRQQPIDTKRFVRDNGSIFSPFSQPKLTPSKSSM